MNIQFTKMQALGNDFVVIDATKNPFTLSAKKIQRMADRHFGIGFDQLLVIESAKNPTVDFHYRIFNADGSEVGQCGNGARCVARYIVEKKLTNKNVITVSTMSGTLELALKPNHQVAVQMGIPNFVPNKIPFLVDKQAEQYVIVLGDEEFFVGAVNVGNPHVVLIVDDVKSAPVATLGPMLESHALFPERVNVGFMQIINSQHIKLRVYERGAGETLACGSGACAAVVVGCIQNLLDREVKVDLPGGQLTVMWNGIDEPVWLIGPGEKIFDGEYFLG